MICYQSIWQTKIGLDLWTIAYCIMISIIYLSDICNGQGTAIEPYFWLGKRISETHHYSWPKVIKPSPAEWNLWQLALTKGLHLGHRQKLAIPLGKWLSMTDLNNKWFTDAAGLELYQRINHEWFDHSSHHQFQ